MEYFQPVAFYDVLTSGKLAVAFPRVASLEHFQSFAEDSGLLRFNTDGQVSVLADANSGHVKRFEGELAVILIHVFVYDVL